MRQRSLTKAVVLTGTVALMTAGCLGGGGGGDTPAAGATVTGDNEVEIMYGFGGTSSAGFQASLKPWAEKNGITIKFNQSDQFDKLIQTRVQGNSPPDIAFFPQPGILTGLASKGKLVAMDGVLDLALVKANTVPGYLDAGVVDGKSYAAPGSMNVKSLWWYDKKNFAAAGLTVPKTHAELKAVFDKVKADGKTPLCIGLESGGATGWPATDWIEDYVLQTGGIAVYDKWITNEAKFSGTEVAPAFDVYEDLVLTDGNVYGGRKSITATGFGTALNPIFKAGDPGCYLGKQGNFIASADFFGKAFDIAKLDETVGLFPTPSVNGESPVLGGGDILGMFTNDAATAKVIKYMSEDPTFGGEWAKSGQFLSPNLKFDSANYPTQTLKDVVELAKAASVFRFDGSDLMPGKVGSGSFWTGMVEWTSGQKDRATIVKEIDASWPAS